MKHKADAVVLTGRERPAMERPPHTAARLTYVRADSALNRRYVAPGAELNTGSYEERAVSIANARLIDLPGGYDENGFALVHHRSAISDLRDPAVLSGAYLREMEEVVQKVTGADKVIAFSALVRDVGNPGNGAQPAGTDVHTDFTPRRGAQAAKAFLAGSDEPDFRCRRFEAINLWRALSPAPQNMPLAVCDGRSIGDGEGIANTMIRVATLPGPDEIDRPLSEAERQFEASLFPYSDGQRWFYYPDMTRDELLMFRIFDSRRTGAWRTPHAAFVDESVAHPVPRVSVEARTFAYFR